MIRFKNCFKCARSLPMSEFYKHSGMGDGHLNKCKGCTKNDAAKHRGQNLDRIREYDRLRAKQPKRVAAAKEYTKQWRLADKARTAAHSAVARAIRSGRLTRMSCEKCHDKKTIAHHSDYSKPLMVNWLCQSCHVRHHLFGKT